MPKLWIALKRSLDCKSHPSSIVHDPKSRRSLKRRTKVHGCPSRPTSAQKNLSQRPVVIGETAKPAATHDLVLTESALELKISQFGILQKRRAIGNGEAVSPFVGAATVRPGTPCPATTRGFRFLGNAVDHVGRRLSFGRDSSRGLSCHKCGDKFKKLEAVEAHHLSKHAVAELVEKDSSRKVIEIICRTGLLNCENNGLEINVILKINNTQKILVQFEEYREMVKARAEKLPMKHPRCLADGNELLRFCAVTVECSLGMSGYSGLCTSRKCSLCTILRHGFSTQKESNGVVGVFTASTSARAFEAIEQVHAQGKSLRRALIVCRVVAGRVHKPTENFPELANQQGFDSLAWRLGPYSNIEELYLLNPKALLPCFLVTCKF